MHFKGFTQRWDEVIDLVAEGETRIKEVGALSKGHGWAKTNQPYQDRLHQDKENIDRNAQEVKDKAKAQRFENAKRVMQDGLNTATGHVSIFDQKESHEQFGSHNNKGGKNIDWRRIEGQFRADLVGKRSLKISEVASDGNCMFHSIAVQAYGSMESHSLIR